MYFPRIFFIFLMGFGSIALTTGCVEVSNNSNDEENIVGDDSTTVTPFLIDYPTAILGNWKLQSATRSGNEADLGTDIFINFDENGLMSSNLPSDKNEFAFKEGVKYTLDGNNIYNETTQNVFSIENATDSSLVLNSTIADFDFQFVFVKK